MHSYHQTSVPSCKGKQKQNTQCIWLGCRNTHVDSWPSGCCRDCRWSRMLPSLCSVCIEAGGYGVHIRHIVRPSSSCRVICEPTSPAASMICRADSTFSFLVMWECASPMTNMISRSSSAFSALSLGFTIFGETFTYETIFNPTIEVVTFCLSGYIKI